MSADAEAIFLVGDVFDFWYEYRRVVPKGFTRLLGKLSELTDRGVAVHFFPGNHDLWAFDYLQTECGGVLHRADYEILALAGKRGRGGRLLSRVFRSRAIQWVFSTFVHPNAAMRFGHWWSGSNRKAKPIRHAFRGAEEPIVRFASDFLKEHPGIDLFVCGHIHCAEIVPLAGGSRIAFLGEWIDRPTYGKLDQNGFTLNSYPTTS